MHMIRGSIEGYHVAFVAFTNPGNDAKNLPLPLQCQNGNALVGCPNKMDTNLCFALAVPYYGCLHCACILFQFRLISSVSRRCCTGVLTLVNSRDPFHTTTAKMKELWKPRSRIMRGVFASFRREAEARERIY